VALRTKTLNQYGALRTQDVKQMLALRAKLSEKSLIEGGTASASRECPFLLQ